MSDFTINDFLDMLKQKRLSSNTILAYQSDLNLIEEFVARPLIEAKEKELFRYFATLSDLKATTVRRRLIAIKRFFDYAEKKGFISEDPAGNLETPSLPKRLPKYLSESEIKQLLDSLNYDDIESMRNMTMIKMLYFTGMRIGEIQQLDIDHVLWDSRQLRVIGKGDKERFIPLNQNLMFMLEEWISTRSTLPYVKSKALFISMGKNHRGKRISYGSTRQIVKSTLKQAGLGEYSPHKLRHTFATQLLEKGVPLEQISELLGHSRLDTTLIYAHTNPGKLRSAVELLG